MDSLLRGRLPMALAPILAAVVLVSCRDEQPTGIAPGRAALSVGASPPPSVPSSVYASSNTISNTSRMAGRFLRNVVVVLFNPGTPQPDRQAAVDAVGGTVVGGMLLTDDDGSYFVQVADNGTDGPLFTAIDKLSQLPQVLHAGPELLPDADSSIAYLAPRDTTTWQTWRLLPDSADGTNWAPEAMAAPMGWGCTTGDSTVAIAVVDHGFHDIFDVDSNVTRKDSRNAFTAVETKPGTYHGDIVTSILAARGNNGTGIAGMMWNADVRQYEALLNQNGQLVTTQAGSALQPWSRVVAAAARAALGGAKVVNLSWQLQFNPKVAATAPQVAAAAATGTELAKYMRWVGYFQKKPLIVIASGNSGGDATRSGFPQALNDATIADRILVVGASRHTKKMADTLAGFSNRGTLVQIAAPGDSVVGLTTLGRMRAQKGTSFAAPAVSGLAGLLLSLDPSLTAAEVKQLILDGARRGGRTATAIPIINAYESLRLVAKRQTAGLCGNRVWGQDNRLMVQRDTNVFQAVYQQSSPVGSVSVQHGNRMQFTGGNGRDVAYRDGQWRDVPSTAAWDTLPGGPDRSMSAYSHGGDSLTYAQIVGNQDSPSAIEVYVQPIGSTTPKRLTSITMPTDRSIPECVTQQVSTGICNTTKDAGIARSGYTEDSYVTTPLVAYSPDGSEVFVHIPYLSNTVASEGAWGGCSFTFDPDYQCRTINVRRTVDSSVVYAVRIRDGLRTRLWSTRDRKAFYLAATEGGAQELVAGLVGIQQLFSFTYSGPILGSTQRQAFGCGIEYRTRAGTPTPFIVSPGACSADDFTRQGTFAPSRGTWGGSGTHD
jgi:subtilisin family serine protease